MAKKATPEKVKDVVVKTETTAPALINANLSSTSLAQFANYDASLFEGVKLDVQENRNLFSNDILIPKVWLTQASSEHRKTHDIKEGTFVDSQNFELLTQLGVALRVVVLKTFKRWHTFEIVKNPKTGLPEKEFVSSELIIWGKNHNLPYQETLDGKDLVRRQLISAYILLERDVKLGLNKPYIIDFARSSKGAGRIMVSDIANLNNAKPVGLPSFVGFFELNAEEEQFDKNSAWVKKVKFGGYLGKEVMPFLVDAYKSLGEIEDQIVIDDKDIIKAEGATVVDANVNSKASLATSKI